MAKFRDRTEEFREAVCSCARNQQYDEAKLAKISESLIMRRPHKRTPFIQTALKTRESIHTLHQFVLNHKKDYMDQLRTTEQDRDNIEHEVGVFVKACTEQINMLKDSIDSGVKNQKKPWGEIQEGNLPNADVIAHKYGVVLILSDHLNAVAAVFEQMRSVRLQAMLDRKISKKMRHSEQKCHVTEKPLNRDVSETEPKIKESYSFESKELQQLLDEETQALQVELTDLLDAVEETESKMIEMSALNHLFSTHVLHQAQQIEHLYEQAIRATENVKKGNEELTKAISRNNSSRTFILLFLVVLPLGLLFLDWYQ